MSKFFRSNRTIRSIGTGAVKMTLLAPAAFAVLMATGTSHAADQFIAPSKEELAMTSQPGYPGAPAVILYREEITKDDLHVHQFYQRIKILTEDGKKEANVALSFGSSQDHGDYLGNENMITDISGRTIHSDGTIIPFTGKPYLKTVEKVEGFKFQEQVFTLPDVQVGSIIEYRYALRYNDMVYESPNWFIQGPLYLKAAHYVWYPTGRGMVDGETGDLINSITWFPILPAGAQIQHHDLPQQSTSGSPLQIYELTIKDVAPQQQEEFMPPIASYTYRVLYNFSQYRSGAEYWKSEGKRWSKRANTFIGPNGDLTAATTSIIAGATTQDEKLHKIYAAVMALENTNYTRTHERQEDKAAGLGQVNNTADVLSHKRGSGTQLTELFIGMARVAGMKAYLMLVPDRSQELFLPGWMSFRQFDGTIAIVNVDGKEMYFDPGTRYCPYGHIAWENTFVQGLRQTDNGTDFGNTPADSYVVNKTGRAVNLTMSEDGSVKGTIDMSYSGSAALNWRQRALRGDSESLRNGLRSSMEKEVPQTLEVHVAKIENVEDYEKPLHVLFDVKGIIGTFTGKRLLLPGDLLESRETAAFPHEKREQAVYFHYPQMIQDALKINFPKNMVLEASPASTKLKYMDGGVYGLTVTPAADSITVRRDYAFNGIIVQQKDYPALRTFYSQFEAKDQENIVLKLAPAEASATPAAPGN